jgi:hypothetical protein
VEIVAPSGQQDARFLSKKKRKEKKNQGAQKKEEATIKLDELGIGSKHKP